MHHEEIQLGIYPQRNQPYCTMRGDMVHPGDIRVLQSAVCVHAAASVAGGIVTNCDHSDSDHCDHCDQELRRCDGLCDGRCLLCLVCRARVTAYSW
jgi:hypothetical protein